MIVVIREELNYDSLSSVLNATKWFMNKYAFSEFSIVSIADRRVYTLPTSCTTLYFRTNNVERFSYNIDEADIEYWNERNNNEYYMEGLWVMRY